MTDAPASAATPKRWPYIIPLVAILALGGVFVKRLMDVEQGVVDPRLLPTILLNTPLPAFDLESLPGRGQALKSEDLKGEVSLINVWGSWCIACVAEHPVLMDIAATGEIPIHGIAWRDDPAKSLTWLGKHGDPYSKVGQDPKSIAAIAFGVTAAPETFLVDKQGVIRYKQTGPITLQIWRDEILPRVKQLKAQP